MNTQIPRASRGPLSLFAGAPELSYHVRGKFRLAVAREESLPVEDGPRVILRRLEICKIPDVLADGEVLRADDVYICAEQSGLFLCALA